MTRLLLGSDRPGDYSERFMQRMDAIRRSQKRLVLLFLLLLAMAVFGLFQEIVL